jgi:superfamily I DNA and/or RNA helicase
MLWQQHRMHPHIGDLISLAYYDGQLVNQTLDPGGKPLPRVVHPFVAPEGLSSKTIVWLDLPWAARDPRAAERGPADGYPRYTNPAEVAATRSFMESLRVSPEFEGAEGVMALTLAVLSPYNQQVGLINRTLSESLILPPKVVRMPTLRSRTNETKRLAHTVDSFQGNQADVILVSLVRNNTMPAQSGLGFLDDAARLNVLLSRAERLLVLVGSWEFFSKQLIAVPLDDSTLPLWHWKKVMTTLEEWFQSGRALKVSARFE